MVKQQRPSIKIMQEQAENTREESGENTIKTRKGIAWNPFKSNRLSLETKSADIYSSSHANKE